jgi:ubiquinone/menaquinone biosynthesis C-methylase UbiE
MSADARIYDSERLARCYAADRPPLHAAICARLFSSLPRGYLARTALDIGCGAGASTGALAPYVSVVTGVDPYPRMLRYAQAMIPKANFVQGVAEALPFERAAFDIVTAAGSLNYADVNAALREVSRALAPGGYFAPYDFSTGQVSVGDSLSAECFDAFERTFPWPPGYQLDLGALPYCEHGLTLVEHVAFPIDLEMKQADYIRYLMSETNVESAVSSEMSDDDARDACLRTFRPLFSIESRLVTFRVVLALVKAVG